MTVPPFPQLPAYPGTASPPRRRRTGLLVTICVLVALALGVGTFLVLRPRSADAGAAHGDGRPAGYTTLPTGCDRLLPAAAVAGLMPDAGAGNDKMSQDSGWGVVRKCEWEHWDDAAGVGRRLEVDMTAFLDASADVPVPSPSNAVNEMRAEADREPTHPVKVPGADEACFENPEHLGVPDLNEHISQKLSARYQNVVVEITYDPGQLVDNTKLANALTTTGEQVLKTLKNR